MKEVVKLVKKLRVKNVHKLDLSNTSDYYVIYASKFKVLLYDL